MEPCAVPPDAVDPEPPVDEPVPPVEPEPPVDDPDPPVDPEPPDPPAGLPSTVTVIAAVLFLLLLSGPSTLTEPGASFLGSSMRS